MSFLHCLLQFIFVLFSQFMNFFPLLSLSRQVLLSLHFRIYVIRYSPQTRKQNASSIFALTMNFIVAGDAVDYLFDSRSRNFNLTIDNS